MQCNPTALVTRDEFDSFCRLRRLAGTKGNRDAGILLKENLEREGFTAFEAPTIAMSWWRLLAVLLVAVTGYFVFGEDSVVILAFFLGAGPMLRALHRTREGIPAAVYGVRKTSGSDPGPSADANPSATGAGEKRLPTIVLCAHYDTASLPVRGSLLLAILAMGAAMFAVARLHEAVHPIAGLAVAAAFGFFFVGNASPGADDNASGVFAVLACLRRCGHLDGVNIVPVFFNLEEQGLIGSRAWVRRHLGKKGTGIPGIEVDGTRSYAINFDCVGRGRRVFITGNRGLRDRLLRTESAKALQATRTWLYPSDHQAFRLRWKAVSFVRANRFWPFGLRGLHSKNDVPATVSLENIVELTRIVEEFVREEARAGQIVPSSPGPSHLASEPV